MPPDSRELDLSTTGFEKATREYKEFSRKLNDELLELHDSYSAILSADEQFEWLEYEAARIVHGNDSSEVIAGKLHQITAEMRAIWENI